MNISLLYIGQAVLYHFSLSCFCLCPGWRKGLEDTIYTAMDLLVNGESDGVSCILVED